MWTARGPFPFGPRPGQPDNLLCIDYLECFTAEERREAIAAYGPASPRRLTHSPIGPIVDPGYHGQLPATDWRDPALFSSVYLNTVRELEAARMCAIHFLRPDEGVAGLAWTVEDLDRELGPLFARPDAQALMRFVCLGWEPGGKYYYNNDWWISMCVWMARTFPKAIRVIHKPADQDSPVGQDDDRRGISNGQGWANVAPYIHGTLEQYGGYCDGDDPIASPTFVDEFGKAQADLIRRFTTGGPDGDWPTSSAWGEGKRLKVYAGEYAAYGNYWKGFPESESVRLGAAAMAAGSDGFFDGGPPL